MKKLIIFLNMLVALSVFGQNISVSKDTVSFFDFWVSHESSDSIYLHNIDTNILSLDSIYIQYYMFYLKIYNNDSLVTESFISSYDVIPLSIQIPPHDSIKIVFNLFVPVIKMFSAVEIYTDTISIFNNSINNPTQKIIVLSDLTLGILDDDHLPDKFELFQNYPNPFNPATIIKFTIPEHNFVTLKVFDLLGREIATLVNEEKSPGIYEAKFDARLSNRQGSNLASGIYIYRLKAGTFTSSKKFVLMK